MIGTIPHAACLVGLLSLATVCGDTFDSAAGDWRAGLQCPGGLIAFQLRVANEEGHWSAQLVNGPESIDVAGVHVRGQQIEFRFPHYDSGITAVVSDDFSKMTGSWRKLRGADKEARLPFVAHRDPPGPSGEASAFEGRWRVQFASEDDPAVGEFRRHESGELWGTFLTTTGDYRYLSAAVHQDHLHLSCFDGAHAFLFIAARQADGSLSGDFWSGDWWHDTWTAQRDETAQLPDAFALTQAADQVDLSALRFRDLQGQEVSLADSPFADRALLIEIFGSWCPNCHDAADYLNRLNATYRERGLVVVGLAFELTGDFARDARQVKKYIERHRVDYPVLVAGLSDKEQASKSFPILDKIRAYPTLVFVRADGRVAAVYTGFSGPATGDAYNEQSRRIEEVLENDVLSLAKPASP